MSEEPIQEQQQQQSSNNQIDNELTNKLEEEFVEQLDQQPYLDQDQPQHMQAQPGQQQPLIINTTQTKNPVSAYFIFAMSWRANNPNQKTKFSDLGQLWKQLSAAQRLPYITQYKQRKAVYDTHIAHKLLTHPESHNDHYQFPLHKVRSIMKQDNYYKPKVEAVATMSLAVEHFGNYLLEEIRKISQGKGRIDTHHLYDCLTNQKNLSFLDCLIVENNRQQEGKAERKSNKPLQPLTTLSEKHQHSQKQSSQTSSYKATRAIGQGNLNSFVSK